MCQLTIRRVSNGFHLINEDPLPDAYKRSRQGQMKSSRPIRWNVDCTFGSRLSVIFLNPDVQFASYCFLAFSRTERCLPQHLVGSWAATAGIPGDGAEVPVKAGLGARFQRKEFLRHRQQIARPTPPMSSAPRVPGSGIGTGVTPATAESGQSPLRVAERFVVPVQPKSNCSQFAKL